MSNEKLLDQIKKLLALSTSPNPHEANLAMAKANAMMLKHNLSLKDVEGGEFDDIGAHDVKYDFALDTKYIQNILMKFFFVEVINFQRMRKWTVIGTESNCEIALYMFHHIRHKFRAAWLAFKDESELEGIEGKTDYYRGLWNGLDDRLQEERDRLKQEEGLVWVGDPRVKQWIQNNVGDLKVSSVRGRSSGNQDAAEAGYEDGRSMSLQHGLEHQRTNSQKQLGA